MAVCDRRTITGAGLVFLLCVCFRAYSLDWKQLHERADSIGPDEVLVLLQRGPLVPDNLYLAGLVYLNAHKNREAGRVFEKLLALRPEAIEGKWGRAEVLRRNGEEKKSEAILNRILRGSPSFAPAHITLAYIKYRQSDYKEAIRLALAVRRRGRENVDISNYTRSYLIFAGAKGMIASSGGPLSKVINGTQVLPNLKRAEDLQPDSPAVLFGLGSFYFLAPPIAGGNPEKARRYLERAIETDPLFADPYVRLAQIYKAEGEREKYELFIEKASAVDPDNALLRDELSGVCRFNCATVEE
jgi:tetratricopeptide (TPR) repeat protein